MILKQKIQNYLINNFNTLKINSKDINKGDVFVALQGNNFHGSKFINHAIQNGACYIISDNKKYKDKNNILFIKNPINFLLSIAQRKRNLFKGKVISITGSIGKSSLKHCLQYFLSKKVDISYSIKSYNNLLGVIISLINLKLDSKFAIFEIGTNRKKEVRELTKIVQPHQIIITNIYPTHLESFKTTKNVAKEKSDIFNPKYNSNTRLLVLPINNDDEEYLFSLSKKYNIKKVISFSKNNNTDTFIKKINIKSNFLSEIKIKFFNKFINLKASTIIEHQITNIMISLIIFKYNRISFTNLIKSTVEPPLMEGRGEVHKVKINNKILTFMDESYNSSPVSMINTINYFNIYKVKKNQKKILIIGEMNELGKKSQTYHQQIISYALATKINHLIFCGDLYLQNSNKVNINSSKIMFLYNENEIIKYLKKVSHNDDIILAKCSNATFVNKFVKKFLEIGKIN